MEQIEKALRLKSELDQLRPIDKERESAIVQKLRLDWNYHSNHLEGNSLTFGETKALLLFGITAQGKPLKDHFEITGHDEAIKWIMDVVEGDRPLTENFIRELHVLLLKESYLKEAISPEGNKIKRRIEVGKYKTNPNHVLTQTGEIFRFATPEETPALMHDLLEWYEQRKNQKNVNSIVIAAEFHYKFIRIHPFDDGNGRTARILMNFILMRFGFPPVIIRTEDKQKYFSVLRQADSGIIEPFIEYIGQNLVRSLKIMMAGARGESIEEPDDLDKEIALLEKKLRTVGSRIEITRTRESILQIYDDSFRRLYDTFIKICEKFDDFYFAHIFDFSVGNAANSKKKEAFNYCRDLINHKTDSIEMRYSYKQFNKAGFGEFNYDALVKIDLGLNGYKVYLRTSDKTIEKKYDEQLSNTEIDNLLKAEALNHKEFIEVKMKEVTDKNSQV